jgi:macrodomain Ter protein organizer (MatP/YcbG family)
MSNQTKILDDILYQELRPWLGKNSLDQKYASKLSSVKEASTDFQFKYEINFHRPFDHKTKYYSKLILSNVKAECVKLIEMIREDNNENLIKYWIEDTLNKRIKTRLKDLGKLIKEKDYALTYIDPKNTSFELDQAHKANTFIVQLLKLAYMQLYLEIQDAFSTWIDDKLILEDFYSQLLLEPVPDKTFIKEVQVIEVEAQQELKQKAKPSRSTHFIHSFAYQQFDTAPDKLTDVWDGLKKNELISNHTTLPNFRKVFSGKEITAPVHWTGNPSELAYFIKLIHNEHKLVTDLKQKQWEVTCKCFITDKGKQFDRSKFRTLPRPKFSGDAIDTIVSNMI